MKNFQVSLSFSSLKLFPSYRISFLLVCGLLLAFFLSACGGTSASSGGSATSNGASYSKVIKVVAAENFYGNIVSQLGGNHVSVLSILSDPNVDPHEYESSVQDAKAILSADLVIENGLNYDTWMDKLLAAAPNANRTLLVGGTIADHPLPDNPHVWYGFDNVLTISQSITNTLKRLDAVDASTFDRNLVTFKQSILPLQQKLSTLKSKYQGTPVALTETIYLYQAAPIGLKILTPFDFEKAVAEGNDPPASTVAEANDQINQKQVKVLIYNEQTVTPITTNLQDEAKKLNIPIVPVTETMPPAKTYQSWMLNQLQVLQLALGG